MNMWQSRSPTVPGNKWTTLPIAFMILAAVTFVWPQQRLVILERHVHSSLRLSCDASPRGVGSKRGRKDLSRMIGISMRLIESRAGILPPWIHGGDGWKYGTGCSAIHRASDLCSHHYLWYDVIAREVPGLESARQALFGRDGTARLRSVGVVDGDNCASC